MGTKVEALKHVAAKGKPGEPITKLAKQLQDLLDVDFDLATEDQDRLAASLLDLDEFKDVVKLANEAANELKEERGQALYDLMVAKEKTKFDLRGKLFYLTSQNFVQADKELGGTKNPHLIEWLENNGMEHLTMRNVNANALRGAVNTWLDQNELEIDTDELELSEEEVMDLFTDSELEAYEGVDGTKVTVAAQLAWRDHQRNLYVQLREIEEHEFLDEETGITTLYSPVEVVQDMVARKRDLLSMVKVTSKPIVGMRSA